MVGIESLPRGGFEAGFMFVSYVALKIFVRLGQSFTKTKSLAVAPE